MHEDLNYGLEVGGATTIVELIEYLEGQEKSPIVAEALADHLNKVLGTMFGIGGSVGRNLIMAQQLLLHLIWLKSYLWLPSYLH